MRITKKWLYIIVATLTLIIVALALHGCQLLDGGIAAADMDGDGTVSPQEAQAAGGAVGGFFGGGPIGSIVAAVIGGGIMVYQEIRKRQISKAAEVVVSKFTDAEVESDLAPETNPVINKLVEKRRKASK